MKRHGKHENSPEAIKSREGLSQSNESNSMDDIPSGNNFSWETDVEKTLQLGEQLVKFSGGIFDLARMEATLAVRTLPKLMMLWLLMMPIMLLAWCAFSALAAWSVVAASNEVGLGVLMFFLLQVLLLISCRWLYIKYRERMTLPYTRAQINNFMRSAYYEFNSQDKAKK